MGSGYRSFFSTLPSATFHNPGKEETTEESEATLLMLLLSVKKSEAKSRAVAPLNFMYDELRQIFFSSLLLYYKMKTSFGSNESE